MKYTLQELDEIYNRPLLELLFDAQTTHRKHHKPNVIKANYLVSIKTGGCSENCSYCSQSAHSTSKIPVEKLIQTEAVVEASKLAKENGAGRVCLGAAWRELRDNRSFERIVEMIREVSAMDLEVCCTLGMLTKEQAVKLAEAGLTAYNHNLDTSEEFYPEIVTTHTYLDRIKTLEIAAEAGLSLCTGGIIGMGERVEDRLKMLISLSQLKTLPESIPVNMLVPQPGTPFESLPRIDNWAVVRMIATTRIAFPKAVIRLSAGRESLSDEEHALCFLAGANSVFIGDRLLTSSNRAIEEDMKLFDILGLTLATETETKSE
jgi:biotin synthase